MVHSATFLGAILVAGTYASAGFPTVATHTSETTVRSAPDDEKHDHKEGEDDHKGEKKELGEKQIAGYTVNVVQIGDIKPGEEAIFVVVLSGGTDKPKTVRGWVGVESGERSIKSKAEDEGKEYHLHHPVSKPLPEKSKLWIELETSAGKKKESFDIK